MVRMLCAVGLAGALGCAMSAERDDGYYAASPAAAESEASAARSAPSYAFAASSGGEVIAAAEAVQPQPPEEPAKRLVVYSARFDILVANVIDSVTRFLKRVEELGGYLESREDSMVTCRVPAKHFKPLSDELRGYGLIVKESVQALDVTKQYFDLAVRIENAEKARQRLLALLEKADKVEDALKIEAEVRRLAEEIDQLKGQLKRLAEQIAYSTIQVVFRSNAPPPRAAQVRKLSRFWWVNEVGVEHVLERF